MAYPRQTSNRNDSNGNYQYTFSAPSQYHAQPQPQPQTQFQYQPQSQGYQQYVDVAENRSYTQSYRSSRNAVSVPVPDRSSYKPLSANTSSHRSAPAPKSYNGYQALQTSSRQTSGSARANERMSAYDKSDYRIIKDGGWENKEHFMLSYDLKPRNHEDVREAGQILDKFREMDAQKEREEREHEQRGKANVGGGGSGGGGWGGRYVPVPVDGGGYDHEDEDDDGDYIDDSGRGDDMISPQYDMYVAQPAAWEIDEPPIGGSGVVHVQKHEDEGEDVYDDGAIEFCERDAGEMIGGGGDDYGNEFYADGDEDEFADDDEDDCVVDYDDGW
ncbi:hypothetical protein BCR34DRAFT_566168 [Clohesyomyces aquaticus]|uniref:Uncharacterized protein n=1 Tax=Clohesyomyces aquaticus TaxID=1231657 RepID=A0A1Y1ZL16_9PLEO|nr:hypothetical protein BCR34DRAFT_566168 [Clohesyomyces aquaticus]